MRPPPALAPLCALAALLLAATPAAAQPFTFTAVEAGLPDVRAGALAWGDVDGDGDLDVFVAGLTRNGPQARLYENTAPPPAPDVLDLRPPRFEDAGADLVPMAYASAAWGDYDGDGDLDLVALGSTTAAPPYQPATRLYRNDGGTLRAVSAGLADLHSGSVSWADVDGDGDLDLLLSGTADAAFPYRPTTRLYHNSGGTWTPAPTDLPAVVFGDAAWGDADGDGDLDLALLGLVGGEGFQASVYRNDAGTFTRAHALGEMGFGTLDWGDYDGDGDLDLAAMGGQASPFLMDGVTRLYANEGDRFREVALPADDVLTGAARWGDYDGDGDPDLLVAGATRPLERYSTALYENEAGTLREHALLIGVSFADAVWGDYDGDGDLDVLAAGAPARTPGQVLDGFTPALTALYRNDRVPLDLEAPPAPATVSAVAEPGAFTVVWDPPAEAAGLTYNLRVGTAPGRGDVRPAHADARTGRRLVLAPGNASAATTTTVRGLAPGTYYWSLQSVGADFRGSAFVDGGAIEVPAVALADEGAGLPGAFAVEPPYPNPFALHATIRYALPTPGAVDVRVYDALGRAVWSRVGHAQAAGWHVLTWDGSTDAGPPAPAGVYFIRLRHGERLWTGRVVRAR